YRENIFKKIWVQPAAGDAGAAVGACLAAWHINFDKTRELPTGFDSMKGAVLGPEFSKEEISTFLIQKNIDAQYFESDDVLSRKVAELLTSGNIIGWFQGRMEFGPRSLGNRSILADARVADNQHRINKTIKFREDFRPFAQSILE